MNTKNKEEEESTEVLRILSWINNIKEYQKIFNHAWKNMNQEFVPEKNRRNKKWFN